MTKMMSLAFALALTAALPLSADAQGKSKEKREVKEKHESKRNGDYKYTYQEKGRNTPPGQKCRAEGGTSNSRACRDRYGDNNRRDDRDSDRDTDGRWDRTSDRTRTSNGGICIDRNRDGRCDGTTGGRTDCTDRDRDGICDTRDSCVDRNADGRCDNSSGSDGRWGSIGDVIGGRTSSGRTSGGSNYPGGVYSSGGRPTSLPVMSTAPRFANGERPSAVRQWLGTYDVRVRYTDRDRDGRVESATWLSPSGTVLQVWQDLNDDGRADRVRLYERGRVVRTIQ